MRKSNLGLLVFAILLAACGKDQKATQLASLDEAYKAGVLTKEEYDAKKAALAGKPSETPTQAPVTTAAAAPFPEPSPGEPQTSNLPGERPPAFNPPPGAPGNAPPPGAGNYYRMKLAKVIDQTGFERPIPALSILIPTDWQLQGGVQYSKGGCTLADTSFRASGPDGRGVELLPDYYWQWSDDPQTRQFIQMDAQQKAQYGQKACDLMPPVSAADLLRRMVVPKIRPGARLVAIEPIPNLVPLMQSLARQSEQTAAQAGLRASVRPDLAKARLQYNVNGQAVEEWISAAVMVTVTSRATFNAQTLQQGQAAFYNGFARLFEMRAPAGKLDANEKFFEMVASTMRVDPTWQARISGVQSNIAAAQIKGAADRSKIISQSNAEVSKIITDGYWDRQKVNDRISDNRSQAIRGVETYRNPGTGETFELDNKYGHAWVNGHNEYILSDQPGFDPNAVLREGNWTALERVQR